MKYVNEILTLMGLGLLSCGLWLLYGVAIVCLTIGLMLMVLGLFKPIIEAFRGSNVPESTINTEGINEA